MKNTETCVMKTLKQKKLRNNQTKVNLMCLFDSCIKAKSRYVSALFLSNALIKIPIIGYKGISNYFIITRLGNQIDFFLIRKNTHFQIMGFIMHQDLLKWQVNLSKCVAKCSYFVKIK